MGYRRDRPKIPFQASVHAVSASNTRSKAIDIRQLRYFVTIAELGSFSAASRHLAVAQPALSRHVRALEEKFGVELMRRDARGARLTEHGERLLHQASAILRQFDMMADMVGGRPDVIAGRVVVGLPTSANAVLAQPLIRETLKQLPNIQLHVIESLSGFLQEWLEAGRLDISLLYDPRPDRTIEIEPVLIEDLYIVGGIGTLPADCDEIPFARLTEFPLALPGPTHALRRLADRVAFENDVRLDLKVEVDSLGVIKVIAEEDGVFTLLPAGPVHAEMRDGRIEARRIVSPPLSRSVSLATSAVRSRTRACDEVKKLILCVIGDMIRNGVWKGASPPDGDLAGIETASPGIPARQ